MSKTFRRYEPDQMLLLPVSLQEWLPSDHLAYFISDVVDQLDLSQIMVRYEGEERGYPLPSAHDGESAAVCLLRWSTLFPPDRAAASRGYRFPSAGGQQHPRLPHHLRLSHGAPGGAGSTILQVLQLCQRAGLVKLGHVSLDGTKVRANASKHQAMSYVRMKGERQRWKQRWSSYCSGPRK